METVGVRESDNPERNMEMRHTGENQKNVNEGREKQRETDTDRQGD